MLKKRGQVTLFIIIAILIVAGIFLFFYIKNKTSLLSPTIPKDIQPIYNFVQNCLENQTKEAISFAELRGGIIYKNQEEFFLQDKVPYYNLQNISISRIESEIGLYIDSGLTNCTSKIRSSDYSISLDKPNSKVEIKENGVFVNINFPITLTKGESTIVIEDFSYRLPANLFYLYNVAFLIANSDSIKNENLCISCIQSIAEEKQVYVSINEFNEEGVLILITPEKAELTNQTEVFAFALK